MNPRNENQPSGGERPEHTLRSKIASRLGLALCLLTTGVGLGLAGLAPFGHHHLSAGRDLFHFHLHGGSHSHDHDHLHGEEPGHEHGHGKSSPSPKAPGGEEQDGGESSRFVGFQFAPPIPTSSPTLETLDPPSLAAAPAAAPSLRTANLRSVHSRGPPALSLIPLNP
ncbi:MAG: hypothetical protein AAF481_05220 [Acidobacteriota bacterium]